MKEISRRSMCNASSGMACGPYSILAIDAEIVVEENGQNVFLHAQWIDELADEIHYEATHESVYDICEQFNKDDGDFDKLVESRDRIEESKIEDDKRFAPFYEELEKMIFAEMRVQGIELEDDDDEEFSNPLAKRFKAAE